MSAEKTNSSNNRGLSDIYVSFIDILFAIVLGQSFVFIVSENGFKSWFVDPISNAFEIATLLLMYGLVITSWIGYHQSTRKYPLRTPYRFSIDVFLLFLYYMGFVSTSNFEIINWVFALSFLSYTIWDIIRVLEYYKTNKWNYELLTRLVHTIIFTIVVWGVVCVYNYYFKKNIAETKWAFFVVLLAILIIYRLKKRYKTY